MQNMKLDIIGIISICKNSNHGFNMHSRLCGSDRVDVKGVKGCIVCSRL